MRDDSAVPSFFPSRSSARLDFFARQLCGPVMQRLHDPALRSAAIAARAQADQLLLQGLQFGQAFAGFEQTFLFIKTDAGRADTAQGGGLSDQAQGFCGRHGLTLKWGEGF